MKRAGEEYVFGVRSDLNVLDCVLDCLGEFPVEDEVLLASLKCMLAALGMFLDYVREEIEDLNVEVLFKIADSWTVAFEKAKNATGSRPGNWAPS